MLIIEYHQRFMIGFYLSKEKILFSYWVDLFELVPDIKSSLEEGMEYLLEENIFPHNEPKILIPLRQINEKNTTNAFFPILINWE